MNFEKFNKVKADLEKLPGVVFYSFNEDSIILQNKETEALYQIPFTEEEDESITLHLKNGEKVTDPKVTLEDQYLSDKKNFKDGITKVFTDYDEGIDILKNHFKNLPNYTPEDFIKTTAPTFEDQIRNYAMNKNEVVAKINNTFNEQLVKHYNEKQEFAQLFNIFNEDGTLKTHNVNYNQMKNSYTEAYTEYKAFCEMLSKMNTFQESIEEIVNDEKLAKAILENLKIDDSTKVAIPKAVVSATQSYTEDFDMNVVDVSKQVALSYNEIFKSSEENQEVFNRHRSGSDETVPQFLKFNTGKYSRDDVETLEHELEQSFYVLPELDDDGMREIADWRNQCTYMSRTGMISDQKMDEIINSFNKQYGGDQKAEFNDPDESLGFRDTEEAGEGNAEGFNDNLGEKSVKDADIEGETESPDEDEEDHEEVKGAKIA